MPSEGYEQKPAGVCVAHKRTGINKSTNKMIAGKVFKIKPQENHGSYAD